MVDKLYSSLDILSMSQKPWQLDIIHSIISTQNYTVYTGTNNQMSENLVYSLVFSKNMEAEDPSFMIQDKIVQRILPKPLRLRNQSKLKIFCTIPVCLSGHLESS